MTKKEYVAFTTTVINDSGDQVNCEVALLRISDGDVVLVGDRHLAGIPNEFWPDADKEKHADLIEILNTADLAHIYMSPGVMELFAEFMKIMATATMEKNKKLLALEEQKRQAHKVQP